MTTRSFIARPTEAAWVRRHLRPSRRAAQPPSPLLLTAYQYRFNRDLEGISRHLVDDVAIGWDELGTDLLDHAPRSCSSRSPAARPGRALSPRTSGPWTARPRSG